MIRSLEASEASLSHWAPVPLVETSLSADHEVPSQRRYWITALVLVPDDLNGPERIDGDHQRRRVCEADILTGEDDHPAGHRM